MPAVLFHAPDDSTYREADEEDPVECALRDALVEEFLNHDDLVTVILRRRRDQRWELQSVDPDEENDRFLAASVVALIACGKGG